MKIQLYSDIGELQETMEIEKTPCRCAEGWSYLIRNKKAKQKGFVEIRFRNLSYFEQRNEPVAEPLIEIIEFDDRKIAEILQFYPHGNFVPREGLEGIGIGIFVLRSVLSDFKDNGIPYAYCRNPSRRFSSLLYKNRFKRLKVVNDVDRHLLRVL